MLFIIIQPVFLCIKAFISYIKPDQTMWYRACKTCNKKVTEAVGSGYWCEGCQKNEDACNLRFGEFVAWNIVTCFITNTKSNRFFIHCLVTDT